MLFTYKIKNSTDQIEVGTIEAGDRKEAITQLRARKNFVISLNENAGSNKGLFGGLFGPKIALKDKIIFTKQLGMMMAAGLSIVDALKSLYEETENKTLRKVIGEITKSIEGGKSLSEALLPHKPIFGEIYINMVKSGEKSGKIEMVLDRLAAQQEKDYDLIRKVKGALSYPIFVLVTMIVVVALVIVMVIPQLKIIFEDANVELPAITRGLIGLSLFLKSYGVFVVLAVAAITLALYFWQKTKNGKHAMDVFLIKVPLISLLLKKSYMARFTRTFGSLVASGLPLIEVFEASAKVIGNTVYEEEIRAMSKKVETGQSLSLVFKKSLIFPKMIGQLSAVGEKSGNIDEIFTDMAEFFEREVDNLTSNLSTMLEPILMVVMGLGVGVVIIAVLQPIYSLVNAI
jgi:type IV pilus assembly protein PilC